jgi:diamine N-acetyltransferase
MITVEERRVRDDRSMESGDRRASGTSETVALREITDDNRQSVEHLRVAPGQEGFVDSVRRSLVEAAATPHARPWFRAAYFGETPVGFVMLGDDVPRGNPHIPWRYYLWRMLIDARFQGRGYGRSALDLAVAYVKTRPDADVLVTSVVAGEGSPLGFYQRYGFELTGEMFDHEHVMQLQLKEIR